jgi:hypothetical protein
MQMFRGDKNVEGYLSLEEKNIFLRQMDWFRMHVYFTGMFLFWLLIQCISISDMCWVTTCQPAYGVYH